MLFVGGPLHGSDVDVSTQSLVASGQEPVPPPTYVDTATAQQWRHFPVQFTFVDPATRQPGKTYSQVIYLWEGLVGAPPQVIQGAVNDAVAKWWFVTFGSETDGPTNPANNGNAEPVMGKPRVWYVATCAGCEYGQKQPFTTASERAKWMQAHIEATGHQVLWSDETEREASDDGGNTVSDVHEREQGIQRPGGDTAESH